LKQPSDVTERNSRREAVWAQSDQKFIRRQTENIFKSKALLAPVEQVALALRIVISERLERAQI
jgi:hypothetical protein